MSLFDFFSTKPIGWHRGKATDNDPTRNQGGGIAISTRETQPMGQWSGIFGQWQPRQKSPWLLEALREAIPMLDGGIGRLVTMDGIIEVEGGNDALVRDIEEWMHNVPVNDLVSGYQAFYTSHSDEHYEQGVGVGEFIYDDKGRDVIGLRVADSKGIVFVRAEDRMQVFYRAPGMDKDWRPDALGTVEAILRGNVRGDTLGNLRGIGYVELDARQCVFALHRPEADNPYGTSIMRSLPFVAQILLKMENATGRAWERFGDPPFHVHYGTKSRKVDRDEAINRAKAMARDLALALSAKQRGNSADLATASAADDEVKIDVIGANGKVLAIEQSARHMQEQIVAGFGLAPWMLGITWSQAAGIGEQQSVVMLQESQTRFAVRKPSLRRPIEAMLRARKRTWKPGDWDIVQRLPNLMDEQKRAQAEFLRAQTALMLDSSGQVETPSTTRGIDNNLRAARSSRGKRAAKVPGNDDEDGGGESWAEADPSLPRIEADTIDGLQREWDALEGVTLAQLGLTSPAAEASFTFAPEWTVALLSLAEGRIGKLASELLQGQMSAWDRGIVNASDQIDSPPATAPKSAALGRKAEWLSDPVVAEAIARLRESVRLEFAKTGLQLVREGIGRTYRDRIVAALSAGEFDGQNPVNVARELQRRFDGGDYNWERLARSEVAMAQSVGKLDLMRQQGVVLYDYETAGDTKVSRICNELADAGPYRIDDAAAPIPVRDSHPNCRCSLRPRA